MPAPMPVPGAPRPLFYPQPVQPAPTVTITRSPARVALPPWSPHLAKPPQKPPPPQVIVSKPQAFSPPTLPPQLPSIRPMDWWFTDAPKQQTSDVDEYWTAPPSLAWKGYKPGQTFDKEKWKLAHLGWTSADEWQFKHLKKPPVGVHARPPVHVVVQQAPAPKAVPVQQVQPAQPGMNIELPMPVPQVQQAQP